MSDDLHPTDTITITITTYEQAKEVYRSKGLRQGLYDDGAVIMEDVLVNLHDPEHRARRRVENRIFRREIFEHYEHDLFPDVIEQTLEPHLSVGTADLVHLGHAMMLNLAAVTAGVDRPLGTPAETDRLHDYMNVFVQGATLAHHTGDKDTQRACVFQSLVEWDDEFLRPSIDRREALLQRVESGDYAESELPKDVLTTLLRNRESLDLTEAKLRREIAFFLLASAHTSATAFVRSIDHILTWLDSHPEDRTRLSDPVFVQRCVHETIRLNPSSPIGQRRALEETTLKDGTLIPQGATVVVDLVSVNRDRSVFGEDAEAFMPEREIPSGTTPFGLSFASGMHVCIGQDLAAGVIGGGAGPEGQLFGLVTSAVQRLFQAGVTSDPTDPPERDPHTARPYWGRYPAILNRSKSDGDSMQTVSQS